INESMYRVIRLFHDVHPEVRELHVTQEGVIAAAQALFRTIDEIEANLLAVEFVFGRSMPAHGMQNAIGDFLKFTREMMGAISRPGGPRPAEAMGQIDGRADFVRRTMKPLWDSLEAAAV